MLNQFYDRFIFTNAVSFRNNNFFLMDIPFVMLPNELLVGLLSSNDSEFNKKLYYSVRDSMKRGIMKDFKLDFKADGIKAVDVVQKYFSFSGWGLIENVQVDVENSRALVHAFNSPFAQRLFGKTKSPCDHFLRGILAGLFSVAFNKDMECVEVHCIALGDKDCQFVIKEQHEFDFSVKETREQLDAKT